jgi:hypothetical protein
LAPLLNLNQTKYPATTTQTNTNRYSNHNAYTTDKRFRQRHTATAAETTAVTNPAAEDAADAAAAASRSRQRRRQQRTAEVPSTADASTTDASVVVPPLSDRLRLFCSRQRPSKATAAETIAVTNPAANAAAAARIVITDRPLKFLQRPTPAQPPRAL